jgi:hypothetical protein
MMEVWSMRHDAPRHERKAEHMQASPPMLLDVQIQQPRSSCPIYTWERERGSIRLTGVYRARPGLPADLAVFQLEGQLELPMLLLALYSSPPGTLVQARLLGALGSPPSAEAEAEAEGSPRPSDGWIFVAVAEVEASLSQVQSLEMLSPAQLAELKAYAQATFREEYQQAKVEVTCRGAQEAARMIRETRLQLKRERRAQPRRKGWLKREEEKKPVAWRAIEGLSETLRAQVLKETVLEGDANAPYAQAEHLIRFVPERFQRALADLFLDDERLLICSSMTSACWHLWSDLCCGTGRGGWVCRHGAPTKACSSSLIGRFSGCAIFLRQATPSCPEATLPTWLPWSGCRGLHWCQQGGFRASSQTA